MSDLVGKLMLTGVVVVLAVPGLVIEPGPFSELTAFAALGTIWGYDLGGDGEQ